MNLKHPTAARMPSRAVVACVLALTVTGAAPSASTRAATQARAACVTTPDEYQTAWNNREVRCVSPLLFATTHPRGSTTIYPSGFWYAWAVSNTNLERYLLLRRIYGDNPPKVGIGILSYAGFPGLVSFDDPMDLAVYTLPLGTQVQVPSFETWFRLLDQEFGDTGAYPLAAQIDLVLAYSRLRPNEDVVGAFQTVTGCRRAALLRGQDLSPKIGCNRSFLGAIAAAGPSPYTTGESTSCFQNFASTYQGPRNAAAMRGVLYQCQDVGFLNTGVGLGYNTYANPFVCKPAAKQTVRQRYTGREFILPNMAFDDLPSHVNIELDLGEPFERGFLFAGYCRIGRGGAGSASGSASGPGRAASVQNNAQDMSIGVGQRTSASDRHSRRTVPRRRGNGGKRRP
ncbi:hypothetical protein GCM10027176_33510 [Actinoallomurus bryophytorum]|uniref:Uncharacterized protein n=1 Tax=Actinoallomurus bryophytorum TaxID=1490222 RepID=A0A543CNB7_9ACTN|nr:hypothetical protein [Actinoallomurus bryophytorum]TQL98450.1 hypothetical protein FB559_4076 [Actinoallomurus bryophytorum]